MSAHKITPLYTTAEGARAYDAFFGKCADCRWTRSDMREKLNFIRTEGKPPALKEAAAYSTKAAFMVNHTDYSENQETNRLRRKYVPAKINAHWLEFCKMMGVESYANIL